jgi:hypothetical protein
MNLKKYNEKMLSAFTLFEFSKKKKIKGGENLKEI